MVRITWQLTKEGRWEKSDQFIPEYNDPQVV